MSEMWSSEMLFPTFGRVIRISWLDELLAHNFDTQSFELTARFIFVVGCIGACAVIWHFAPLPVREKKAAVAAGVVHFLLASSIELFVMSQGVYNYIIQKQMLWDVPFDIHLGWAALWGAGLCMGWRSVRGVWKPILVAGAIGATLAMDFAALGTGQIFTPLTPLWWLWDLGALVVLALSTLAFFKLVLEHHALYFRAAVYGVGYGFIFYLLLPAMILTLSRSRNNLTVILNPLSLAALAICSLPGLIAAFQFATNGNGSPLPLDPTRKLVTNGIYAYVRNPMQISGVCAAIVWAVTAQSWFLWIYVFDLAVLLTLTKIFEDRELAERFGSEFDRYRTHVWCWLPRLTPYH